MITFLRKSSEILVQPKIVMNTQINLQQTRREEEAGLGGGYREGWGDIHPRLQGGGGIKAVTRASEF